MINTNKLVKVNKEQIRVYKELIEGLKQIKNVIDELDGKVINIKLEKLATSAINKEDFYVTLSNNQYSNNKELTLYCKNRSFQYDNGNKKYMSTSYVDYPEKTIVLKDKRLNSKETKKDIDTIIASTENKIQDLQSAINNIVDIKKEYEEIYNRIKLFNEKVPYEFRELFNFKSVY